MRELKRLRDLPGVSEIERMCRVSSYFDARNKFDTMERINEVSISLFCIPPHETGYECYEWGDDEDAPTQDQWEALLSNAMRPFAQTEPFWRAIGWDISDGMGHELACAHWFARQIIVCELGGVGGVEFVPDGSGHEPRYEGPELSEEELTERLEAQVAEFLSRKV